MKPPACNTHPSAVRLREAALAFAKHAATEPKDDKDKEGQRLNRALLAAAIKYARVGDDLCEKAGRALQDLDEKLLDGSLMEEGCIEYLCDNVRPLVCELLGHKPHCGDTDQCRDRPGRASEGQVGLPSGWCPRLLQP